MKFNSAAIRKACRLIHRDLSYFFSGLILIYAISGFVMNHRDSFNPDYKIEKKEYRIDLNVDKNSSKEEIIEKILKPIGEAENYTKHYLPTPTQMKIFLKGGSNVVVESGNVLYESVTRRTFLSNIVKLHYNPGRWWTIFSDLFAVALLVITVTGLIMVKGKNGLMGRGGIELIVGILLPILFMLT